MLLSKEDEFTVVVTRVKKSSINEHLFIDRIDIKSRRMENGICRKKKNIIFGVTI